MIVGALELGGSHVSAARVDPSTGGVDEVSRLPIDPGGSRDELLDTIREAARSIAAGVDGVGVATPGPFDYEQGICTIRGLGKLEALHAVDLRSELSRVFWPVEPRAIRFLNDGEAFLLGEACAGAAAGHARAIGLTLGTGLGSAFLVDREIVRAGPGVPPEGNLHVVPFRGRPVEDAISGRGIRDRFDGHTSVEAIAKRADGGDRAAAAAFAALAADLGAFLAPWIRDFRPGCIVVGGSIARAWSHFGPSLAQRLEADVVPAARLDHAALIGAALHASGVA